MQPVLVAGEWRPSQSNGKFRPENPAESQLLPETYPVSSWADCEAALTAAVAAFRQLQASPTESIARFLEAYAKRIEARAEVLVDLANLESALPKSPRLKDVELPRTTGQLRQAAAAAREQSWRHATIDTKLGIRSQYASIGPVAVFGPNNFPFAFNSVAGGDFAAAIAAGNPVIGKANTSHPGTTRLLAEEALLALQEAELPAATVQLLYRLEHADGEQLVADARLGATGYTGSRSAGLRLKQAADNAGKPIYVELSSINPVVMLPGAIRERGAKIAEEFASSALMGTGQFCTSPGFVVMVAGDASEQFIHDVAERFQNAPVGTLLSSRVCGTLLQSVAALRAAGAQLVVGGTRGSGASASYANTLLRATGAQFLAEPERLQGEAFGNVSLFVVADDIDQAVKVLESIEGNLTGCIYSDTTGADDELYARVEPPLRRQVGRLLNDKMPTGVAVSAAMNHGGPFPATGHPGFTAVGIPASLLRFAKLDCYDNVRPARLPIGLQDQNPNGQMWRSIDGAWTRAGVAG